MRLTPAKIALFTAALGLAACTTVPEEPVVEEVVIDAPPIRTCVPMSALTRVVIPAETKTYIEIVEIENPPYEPIQRRETKERVIKPEQIIFVDSEGREVTDVCDAEVDPDNMVDGDI